MAILLLHRPSGEVIVEAGSAEEYARDHGFDVTPAVLDGDEWIKLLLGGNWAATGQTLSL